MFGFKIQTAGIKKVPLNSRVEEGNKTVEYVYKKK